MITRAPITDRLALLVFVAFVWAAILPMIAKRLNRLARIIQHDRRRQRWERRKVEIDLIALSLSFLEGPARQSACARALMLLAADEADPWPDLAGSSPDNPLGAIATVRSLFTSRGRRR